MLYLHKQFVPFKGRGGGGVMANATLEMMQEIEMAVAVVASYEDQVQDLRQQS